MENTRLDRIKLTAYSHGAGCGCKISPSVLDQILSGVSGAGVSYSNLLVGNSDRDDAAVFDLGDGTAIISTTDFFMPIVDDPGMFGQIAAANAISDVYAMGGTPLMAIAILGWPVKLLSPEIAGMVIEGAQMKCMEAGIPLAGGHSIDAPEPVFGLAVTGRVKVEHLKKNGGALPGDIIFLTKPLGTGILSTAQKQGKLNSEHEELASAVMTKLNDAGERLGKMKEVHAMTDVTGFGLGGHLIEMCKASGTSAHIDYDKLPLIDKSVHEYISQGCIPGGTIRNHESYGSGIKFNNKEQINILCDPQTSGGLLFAVDPGAVGKMKMFLENEGLWFEPIGVMGRPETEAVIIDN